MKKGGERCREYNEVRGFTGELEERFPVYRGTQFNIIVDVLGGYSRDVKKALKELVGDKSDTVALPVQEPVITSSLILRDALSFSNNGH